MIENRKSFLSHKQKEFDLKKINKNVDIFFTKIMSTNVENNVKIGSKTNKI